MYCINSSIDQKINFFIFIFTRRLNHSIGVKVQKEKGTRDETNRRAVSSDDVTGRPEDAARGWPGAKESDLWNPR